MDFGSYRDSEQFLEKKNSANWLSWCCYSPFAKYVLPSFLASVVIVTSVYFGLLAWLPDDAADLDSRSTCHLQPSYYVPCLPGAKVESSRCLELGCCWRSDVAACYHPFPSPYGYRLEGETAEGGMIIKSTRKQSPGGKAIRQRLGFRVDQLSNHHARIALRTNDAKLESANARRRTGTSRKLADFGDLFRFLPDDTRTRVSRVSSGGKSSIEVLVHEPNFSVSLRRAGENSTAANGSLLLSSARGPLIVTDNYWEWTLYLTSGVGAAIYGLGSLELNGTSNWIYNNENATLRPGFVAIDPQGNAMACFINYTGPLEVQVLNKSNLIILRGLSVPEEIGIEVFSGPSGIEASQQIALATHPSNQRLIQPRLYGLHLCPEVGRNKNKKSPSEEGLASLRSSITAMNEMGAPWDSHCLHRKLGGLGLQQPKLSAADAKNLADAKKLLAEAEKSFATHLTPMLHHEADGALQSNLAKESCLLLNASSHVHLGQYEGRPVVYPDWAKSRARELAQENLDKYIADLSPDFVVLRDTWPKDEVERPLIENSEFEYLPEVLRSLMSRRTLPHNVLENYQRHYTRHNSYAEVFAGFVGSRSSLMEIRGEACNTEKVKASWASLRGMLQAGIVASMAGIMPSAMYVCGAEDLSERIDEELCDRWYGAAVAWPWILAHPEKSPGSSRLTKTTARRIAELLRLRASLISYHHTVLASYLGTGAPILSATRLHYPDEHQPRNATLDQFFWGESLLIGLVTQPKRKQVHMWLPGRYSWRHLHGGSPIDPTGNGSVSVPVFDGQIVILLRPGRIVPVHRIDAKDVLRNSNEAMRKNLRLLANPSCSDESTCRAEGRIYYGDGEFLLARLDDDGTRLTLENVAKVKTLACGSQSSQATLIETVEVLGAGNANFKLDICEYDLEGRDEIVETLVLQKSET